MSMSSLRAVAVEPGQHQVQDDDVRARGREER
jgi:hypothetical protein